jgi:hypothetical protein
MSAMRKARAEKTRAAAISIFQRNPNRPLRTPDISATIRMTAAKEGWEPLEALAQLVNMMRKESGADPSRYGGIIERTRTGHYQFIPLSVAALIKAAGLPSIDRKTEEKQ